MLSRIITAMAMLYVEAWYTVGSEMIKTRRKGTVLSLWAGTGNLKAGEHNFLAC